MQKEIDFRIKENTYKVSFPNVGQFVDIEVMKASLSKNMYSGMVSASTKPANYALDFIDMEAHLMVLMPEQFLKDLKVNSLRELSIEDGLEVRKAFNTQLIPFIKSWQDLIDKKVKENSDG
jgi:hypothetical protein